MLDVPVRRSVVVLLTATILTLVPLRHASAQGLVEVFVDCVRFEPATNTVTALFGYVSTHTAPVTLPLEQDFFSPGNPDRGQPFEFEPGLHRRAFATAFVVSSLTPQLVWEVTNLPGNETFTAVAQNDPALYCDALSAKAFTSGVFTFPKGGLLTVTDAIVTPGSVIVVQYVGDRPGSVPVITAVGAGQFTVRGARGKQFRYVVFD
jgi:hypothetical protein